MNSCLLQRPLLALSASSSHIRASRSCVVCMSHVNRREGLALGALVFTSLAESAKASDGPGIDLFKKDLKKGRRRKIPDEAYTEMEGTDGFKYYDVAVGGGQLVKEGDRVVVHYEARWKGITFMTSRQGMGVTGGTPYGFNVGAIPGQGGALKGLDLAVRGMRVGGQRSVICPPQYAYGSKGVGEIPPNATLTFEVELLSIKQNAMGYQVKLVEG